MQKFYNSLVDLLKKAKGFSMLVAKTALAVGLVLILSDVILGTSFGVLQAAAGLLKVSRSQIVVGGLVVYFIANK